MIVRQIADDSLAQYAYLIGCQRTGEALLIDPERDVDRYLELVERESLRLVAVAETHIHADFLSGARELAERVPGLMLYLSAEGGEDWQSRWAERGGYRVRFLHHGDRFDIGQIAIQALHTPGHTPEHLSFVVTDRGGGADSPIAIATGDFVFVGDLGRPDLLESAAGVSGAMRPSARQLRDSARSFLELPDHLQVWPGHGAGSACGKALGAVPQSTVGYERRFNPALGAARGPAEPFVDAILDGQPEPPLYFARMKRLNRDGVPLLGQLPDPPRLRANELAALGGRQDLTVVDTRRDLDQFLAGHLPSSIWAPIGKTLATIAGSYVDPDQPLYLIVDEHRREEAIRALIRVGLDTIAGWAPPSLLAAVGPLATTPRSGLESLDEPRATDTLVVDVRSAAEHAARHVPGSINIPHTRLAARLDEIPRDRRLLVHCASGPRAGSAVSLLERDGRQTVFVDGSFASWQPAS